jgi:hypothetical protein
MIIGESTAEELVIVQETVDHRSAQVVREPFDS